MGSSMEAIFAEMQEEERKRRKQMEDMIKEMDEKRRNTGAMGEQFPNPASAMNAFDNLVGAKVDGPSRTLDLKHGAIGQGVRKLAQDASEEFTKAKELGVVGTLKQVWKEGKEADELPSASAGDMLKGLWEGIYRPFVANPTSNAVDAALDMFDLPQARRKQIQDKFASSFGGAMGINTNMTEGEAQEAAMETIANVASVYLGLKAGQSISAGARADRLLGIPRNATNAEIMNVHIPAALDGLAPLEQAKVLHTLTTGVKDLAVKGAVEGVVGGITLGLSERDVSASSMFDYMKAGAMLGATFEGAGGLWSKHKGMPTDMKSAMYQETIKQNMQRQVGLAVANLQPEAAVAFATEFKGIDIVTPFQAAMDRNTIQVFKNLDPRSIPKNLGTKVLTHTNADGSVKAIVFGDGAWEVAEAKRKVRGTVITNDLTLRGVTARGKDIRPFDVKEDGRRHLTAKVGWATTDLENTEMTLNSAKRRLADYQSEGRGLEDPYYVETLREIERYEPMLPDLRQKLDVVQKELADFDAIDPVVYIDGEIAKAEEALVAARQKVEEEAAYPRPSLTTPLTAQLDDALRRQYERALVFAENDLARLQANKARLGAPSLEAEPMLMVHGTAIPAAEGNTRTFADGKTGPQNLYGQGGGYFTEAPDIASGTGRMEDAGYAGRARDYLQSRIKPSDGIYAQGTTERKMLAAELMAKIKGSNAGYRQGFPELILDNPDEVADFLLANKFGDDIAQELHDKMQSGILDKINGMNMSDAMKTDYVLELIELQQSGAFRRFLEKFQEPIGLATAPVYIKMKSPLDIEKGLTIEQIDDIIAAARKMNENPSAAKNFDGTPLVYSQEQYAALLGRLEELRLRVKNGASAKAFENFDRELRQLLRSYDANGAHSNLQNVVYEKAGFDGIIHHGGLIFGAKPHRVVIPFRANQIVPAVFAETSIPLTTAQKAEFSATGHYVGQEVSYNGKNYIFGARSKFDRVRLIDPTDGSKQIVPLANISDVASPKHYEFKDGAWREFDPNIPISEAKDVHLLRDEIMATLSEGDKLTVERNLLQQAESQMTMSDMLNRNNLIYDGNIIFSLDDPNLRVPIKNHADLVDFVEKFNATPVASDVIEGVQGLSNLGMLDKANAGNINLGARGEWVGGREALDWFRTSPLGNMVAPINFMYKSIARKTGLDLVLEQAALGDGIKRFSASMRPWVGKFTMILKPVNDLKGDMRAVWGRGLETVSERELRVRGLSGRAMTAEAQSIADNLVRSSTAADRQVGSRYLTTKLSIQAQLADGTIGKKEFDSRMKMLDEKGNHGNAVTDQQKLIADKLGEVTGRYVEAEGKLVWEEGMTDAGLLEVTSLADAIEFKTPSRAEFAADPANNITPELQRAWTQYDMLMQELAKEAGIPYQQQMWGYMPHIKKYLGATVMDPAVLRRMKIGDASTMQFVHELTRTGFFDQTAIVTDPIQATSKYLYSVMRQKHLEPALVALKDKLNTYRKGGEFNLEQQGPKFNTAQVDPRAIKYVDKMMEHIEGMVRHVADPADMIADANFESWVNSAIGGDATANRNWTSTWLKWMEYKAQGFKPVAGLRDATSVMQSYMFLFGPERTRRLIMTMNQAAKRSKDLAESGITAGRLDINRLVGDLPGDVPNAAKMGKVEGAKNKSIQFINEFTDRAAETGFKWSLQPQIYQMMHGAAYIEATKTFADGLVQLQKGTITPEKFRAITSLDLYPQAIEAQFDKLVKAGEFNTAVDFIAQRTGEMAVGQYGLMNNPMMYKTKVGKLFGQYGQWPLWMLSNIGEGLTQGTPATIGKRAAFLGLSSAAAYAGTQATGIDFNKWTLNPLTMIPLGSSPAFQMGMNMTEALDFSSPMQAMNWEMLKKQLIYAAKPWPMEFDAILQAGVLAQEGEPIWVIGARLLGAGLDSKKYKMADYNIWDFE